jgi:glycosyltransferase involved in cell wall biosynthesis
MKILLINTYDIRGGAARATWRLFEGLKATGNDVKMLVQERRSHDPSVIAATGPVSGLMNPVRPYIDFALPLLRVRKRILFSTSLIPDRIAGEIDRINPDVVHLNWITGGFIRIESLAKINRPVIWTLHDMWAFTGGCHNTVECIRYRQSCGRCPILHSSSENDLSRKVFQRKQKAYQSIQNLTITTPGRWLAKLAMESPLLQNRRVEVVPNGLDTNVYKPLDKRESRQKLGLPQDKKLILFGAIRGVNNPIKGFDLLMEALRDLDPDKYELLVFGSERSAVADNLRMKTRFFGHISDESMLVALNSAADVVAVPSLQEVFGQAASEAMACGTPVVAFAHTGLLDIVKHQETGFLATPFKSKELAEGIAWIVADDERYRRLSEASRAGAVEKFDAAVVADSMLELYKESLLNYRGVD